MVITAANGTEALLAAEHNHIDLILTDFSLPDMTGLTVVCDDVQYLGHLIIDGRCIEFCGGGKLPNLFTPTREQFVTLVLNEREKPD